VGARDSVIRWTLAAAFAVGLAAIGLPGHAPLSAQARGEQLVQDDGHVALGLALRKLAVSGTFMQIAAHPDDEHNNLLALVSRRMGLRAVSVQTTRGGGGQNEIGPELFQDLAVLRTSELLSAHRFDGAEQYFTRAIDYGYSFDPQEVIGKWGHDAIVGDFVRLIRTIRPDVVLTMNIQGSGGDRAHEATTILSREAYLAAGDPAKYPDQITEGLRPWQASKLYETPSGAFGGRGGGRVAGVDALGTAQVDTAIFDPVLGQTYAQIGFDARSEHKCQGMGGLPPLPGVSGRGFGGRGGGRNTYELVECGIAGEAGKPETSLFDGVDTRLTALAHYAGANPPAALSSALQAVAHQAALAQQAFDAGDDAGTAAPVEAGLASLRDLRAKLGSIGLDAGARYEIDFRLAQKERDYENAVLAAHGVTFDAIANDGLVIDGQPVKLSLVAINHGTTPVGITSVAVSGFDGAATCAPGTVKPGADFTCAADVHVPADAALTTPYFTDHYWSTPANHAIDEFAPGVPFGIPFRPSPFHVTFHVHAGSVDVTRDLPVQFRYVEDVYTGPKRMELSVVPALSVSVTPRLSVIPTTAGGSAPPAREVHVAVTNSTKGQSQATVRLEAPAGWRVTPSTATLSFTREDQALSARFDVSAPGGTRPGNYELHAVATSTTTGPTTFDSGYQTIEYPHVERRQVIKPAAEKMEVVDVKTAPGLKVGYIVGVGDEVPPAIEQLGATVSFIQQDELAWGDLSKYDVIVTGVRAYERRADLRAYNQRLLDYASKGGTVIVQYNKFEFNDAQYGPYPAKVSSDRVADETVPVTVLVPDDPVFNFPNKIGPETWANWVQERGLYFLGDKDPRYVDLVSMVDSFKDNPGVKRGALVEARVGKGRWLYLGLGLWRQLPAGTPGAYQLLANLISLPKAPAR
jgi:LmbE family N-acetylglucosaminyl deacetylase